MKKLYINPDAPDMFFYKGYENEYPEQFENALNNGFKKIHNSQYVVNGLLRIRSWKSDQILGEFGYFFVSKKLMSKLIERNILGSNRFIPVSYGWVIDPDTPPIELPEFYLLDLSNQTDEDPIYMNEDESPLKKLYVNEDVFKIITSFDNEWLKYEVVNN